MQSSSKQPPFLGLSISGLALAGAIWHLRSPQYVVDGATVGLVFIAVAPWLGRFVKSIAIEGVGSVVWQKVERLEKRVDEDEAKMQELKQRAQQDRDLHAAINRVLLIIGDLEYQALREMQNSETARREWLELLVRRPDIKYEQFDDNRSALSNAMDIAQQGKDKLRDVLNGKVQMPPDQLLAHVNDLGHHIEKMLDAVQVSAAATALRRTGLAAAGARTESSERGGPERPRDPGARR